MTDNDLKIINHTLTRLLAMREHSACELHKKLLAKGFTSDLVEQQLQAFQEANLQSDERFAESFVRSRANKGQGPQRIRMALQEHRIDSRITEQALQESDVDFFELARQVYQKKYGQTPVSTWQEKQKRMAFLQYRGFDSEQMAYGMKNPTKD